MSDINLIVSNPPHHRPTDYSAAARYFGAPVASVRMKANYPVPEIWFAEEDRQRLESTARHLGEAGLRTVMTDGESLASVPSPCRVASFEFTDTALIARLDEGEVPVAFDAPLFGVFCQPTPPQEAKSSTSLRHVLGRRTSGYLGMSEPTPRGLGTPRDLELEHSPFLDLYVLHGDGIVCLSVVQTLADFGGLHMSWRRAGDNMLVFLAECQDRFKHATFDRRLVGMRVRKSLTVTEQTATPQHRRNGFSYATKTLVSLLNGISPDLSRLGEPALASRLVYLTHRQTPDALQDG